mgnify:FL=1
METEQLNVRVSEDLVNYLDLISNLLKVNRSEWIKTKLAEEVHKEKGRLLMELSSLYAKGMISKKDVESLVGKEISDQMQSILEVSKRTIKSGKLYGKELKKVHN